jgi:hypothetical protein
MEAREEEFESKVTAEAGKRRRVIVRSVPNPTMEKNSVEVSIDVKMEVWQDSILFGNEVFTVFV